MKSERRNILLSYKGITPSNLIEEAYTIHLKNNLFKPKKKLILEPTFSQLQNDFLIKYNLYTNFRPNW